MKKIKTFLTSKDLYILSAIIFLWTILLIISDIHGNFPLNDDWSYAFSVKTLLEQGKLELTGWVSMPVVTQIIWGYLFTTLFGFSFDILRLSTVILGTAGIIFSYLTFREVTHQVHLRVIGVFLIAINPLYFLLSTTFMTDVPFLTFSIVSIYSFVKYYKLKSRRHLILGLLFIAAASFIRQLGGLTLIAFTITYFFTHDKLLAKKIILISFTILLFASLLIFPSLVQIAADNPLIDNTRMAKFFNAFSANNLFGLFPLVKNSFIALVYIGLFLSPIVFIYYPSIKKIVHAKNFKKITVLLVLSVLIMSLLIHFDKLLPFRPNILFYYGIGPATLRDVDILELEHIAVIPKYIWIILTFIGLINAIFISLLFLQTIREKFHLKLLSVNKTSLFIFLTACLYLIFISLSDFYDRYIIFLLPLILFLILNSNYNLTIGYFKKGIVCLTILVMAFFTVYETHNYFAWNRCRWEAIDYLTESLNIPKVNIDGGFEFNAWYGYQPNYIRTKNKSWWWVKDDEYLIAFGEMPAYTTIKKFSYSSITKTKFLYALRKVK